MKKTCSFAIVHMSVAFTVGLLMTGDFWVGSALALVEPACNTVAFYFHEKFWNRSTGSRGRAESGYATAICRWRNEPARHLDFEGRWGNFTG